MAGLDPVALAARAGEPDRYLAALYAPQAARARLMALAAFAGDLGRIKSSVREPLLVGIRLQWWRDAIAQASRGEATGHPIADALRADLASGLLPAGLLQGMIDAAEGPSAAEVLADDDLLRAYLNKSETAAFVLAARALGSGHAAAVELAAQRAGAAYGLARLLALSHGQGLAAATRLRLTVRCNEALQDAKAAARKIDAVLAPAVLPLAMTGVYLAVASGAVSAEGLALRRWWRLWLAGTSGRL